MPVLMGSLTKPEQLPLDTALADRNQRFGVDHGKKAKERSHIQGPGVHENADSWWKEAAKGDLPREIETAWTVGPWFLRLKRCSLALRGMSALTFIVDYGSVSHIDETVNVKGVTKFYVRN